MSQQPDSDFDIDPTTTSGADLAGILNRLNDALLTMRSGSQRPTSIQVGTMWLDTANAAVHYVKYYVAVDTDIVLYAIDTGTDKVTIPMLDGEYAALNEYNIFTNSNVFSSSIKLDSPTSISSTITHAQNDIVWMQQGFEREDIAPTRLARYEVKLFDGSIPANRTATFVVDSTGNASVEEPLPTLAAHLTRKDYVDSKFAAVVAGTFTTNDGKTVSYNEFGVITSIV
ncbi:MAG: hypothetical protein DRI24_24335 [Deltaproteobacteria bacterium]|nr:MAG: hypothetical protein DRI24_24335 [Deltaproteobacteria bacterium]